MKTSLATHLLIELFDCDSKILNDSNQVKNIFIDAAKKGKATIVDVFSCDDKLDGDKIKQILEKKLKSKEVYTKIINRG
jgi:S-adenosylmethionine/arginine decarboxylase-like enzyme